MPPLDAKLLTGIRDTLIAGRYTLFVGAGINEGGKLRSGRDLPFGDALRQQLVSLKGIKASSSLARAYSQLTQAEKDEYLTDPFSKCTPGPAVSKLPFFFWRRIFTLNIDDALEVAYESSSRQQIPHPKTHAAPYIEASDINSVQIVHVHGWSRKPEDGYVFSLAEYANSMGPGNPWVNVLAHTIATEPFIIAGASLEEPDLEYFLKGRSPDSVRTDRGPSFLVEPFPDSATEKECERHGLNLYKGTFAQFLSELEANFPDRPLPINAPTGLSTNHFKTVPSKKDLALFAQDFSFVTASQGRENADLGFLVGRAPSFDDIALSRDIPRKSTLGLKGNLRTRISTKDWSANFLLIDESAGGGKSTILLRAMFDLAAEGVNVFQYRSISSPDIDVCARIFNALEAPFIIACDNFADHVPAIVELYKKINRNDFLIVACERSYRMNYVHQALAGNAFARVALQSFDEAEAKLLSQKLDSVGLASLSKRELDSNARDIARDPIAIAVCRILNNFRSADQIVDTLIKDADDGRIERYLACALDSYCYRAGFRYDIISSAFTSVDLQKQFNARDILPLAYSDPKDRNHVVPLNPVLGERLLRRVAEESELLVFEIYCALGAHLASYVNRNALRMRTPEARIAGRMFDYDDVVDEFIPKYSEEFYLRMKRYWDWNSRYWEQLALLKLDRFLKSTSPNKFDFLNQAISHARHGIVVERHPLGLTTLGRILIEQMKQDKNKSEQSFDEAFTSLDEAIRIEGNRNRIAIHPYTTLFGGASYYLQHEGTLSGKRLERLKAHMDFASRLFDYDSSLLILVNELRRLTS